jgi:hypothetical protein
MKRIKIDVHYSKKDGYYIHLNNCGFRSFRTKKQAEKFVVDYRNYIQNNVRNVFSLNASLTSLYWSYYFELTSSDTLRLGNDLKSLIDKSSYIFRDYSNGNTIFALNSIQVCYDLQRSFIVRMKSISRSNKYYHLSNQIKSIIHQYNLSMDDFYKNRLNFEPIQKQTKIINLNSCYRIAQ